MKFAAALAILPALAAAAPAAEPRAAAPTNVKINGVTYGGTGCPQGSIGTAISEDRSTLTLIFDSYVASIGNGIAITENRKNCQLNVALGYPAGFQYSVFSADYRGYAALDKGVTGTIKSTYYFSGSTSQTSSQADFSGPVNGDYLKHDEAPNYTTILSPCGGEGMLNINSQIRLSRTDTKAQGLLTSDSIDAKFKQVIYVNWLTCKNDE